MEERNQNTSQAEDEQQQQTKKITFINKFRVINFVNLLKFKYFPAKQNLRMCNVKPEQNRDNICRFHRA